MTPSETGPDDTTPRLTETEHEALAATGDLYLLLLKVVGTGPTRDQDLVYLGVHIEAIQRTVMAQAAARSYPGTYRLLGHVLVGGPVGGESP
ncbi:MAG: hypothetical protein ACRDQD_01150 [Nocardioidaceae bacterium]